MRKHARLGIVWTAALCSLPSVLFWGHASAQSLKASINRVAIVGSERGIEVRVSANQPVATETRVLTEPDRIVVDFPGALPGRQLRGLAVKRAGIKAVRVGLFSSSPPITRVVLDLFAPIPYELVPSGNSVIVRLGTMQPTLDTATAAQLMTPSAVGAGPTITTPTATQIRSAIEASRRPVFPPVPRIQVSFQNGLLSVNANKATLAEVLHEVQLHTGADIPIPAGAEQERVVAKAGPGPAKQVLATLLNGSRFNFIVMGSDQDASGLSVILTPKVEGGSASSQPGQSAPPAASNDVPSEVPDVPIVEEAPPPPPAQPAQPSTTPGPDENQAPPDEPPNAPPPAQPPPSEQPPQ